MNLHKYFESNVLSKSEKREEKKKHTIHVNLLIFEREKKNITLNKTGLEW